MTNDREHFQKVLESFSAAMLVTRDEEDELRGRPMWIAKLEQDADLWFALRLDSPKVHDLIDRPSVAVVFQEGGRYASISGTATINRDERKIAELWQETWKPWFPGGQDDPQLGLLHVAATRGEYWDDSGARAMTLAIRAGYAYWQGEAVEIPEGMNAKVDLGD